MSPAAASCHQTSGTPSTEPRANPSALRIVLAGNPNTGKTSLFNRLTGSQARVGNYPGVTVERLTGQVCLPNLGEVALTDLPGTYSLVARSHEEQLAMHELIGLHGEAPPELVVVCVDATNLLRNLYLVLQLQELELPLVIALTMMDEAAQLGLEPARLAALLGVPVVPVVARSGQGVEQLRAVMAQALLSRPTPRAWVWTPSPRLEAALEAVMADFPPEWPRKRALALWCWMSVDETDELEDMPPAARARILQGLRDASSSGGLTGEALDDEVVQARYAWLDATIGPLITSAPTRKMTERVDAILLHPVLGFVAFLLTMTVVFQALFSWSEPAIGAIEQVFEALGGWTRALLPAGILTDFLVEGLLGGVGSVLVFLPQILLLFFFIGLMEDSGYMSRVAYLMDRIMKTMGLHGRAFVPMLSGFACAIPAIMATRTMERTRDRILTMLTVPLMTCSARLPVYTLLIGAVFPATLVGGFFPLQSLMMIGMYLFSVSIALLAAWVLSRTVLPAPPSPLVLELPPYRLPRLQDVALMMVRRTKAFLSEAGTVILTCTVILWALLSFPRMPAPADGALLPAAPTEQAEAASGTSARGEALRSSYGGRLGHALEPLIAPLGFDWKIGVGLIGAFAAREVFVATMGVVYNVGEDAAEDETHLRERIHAERHPDGTPVYTPLVGVSLMVFFALACQCMSTLAVVKRETRGWRWPVFLFLYMTALAWAFSFVIYQGGRLLGLG